MRSLEKGREQRLGAQWSLAEAKATGWGVNGRKAKKRSGRKVFLHEQLLYAPEDLFANRGPVNLVSLGMFFPGRFEITHPLLWED